MKVSHNSAFSSLFNSFNFYIFITRNLARITLNLQHSTMTRVSPTNHQCQVSLISEDLVSTVLGSQLILRVQLPVQWAFCACSSPLSFSTLKLIYSELKDEGSWTELEVILTNASVHNHPTVGSWQGEVMVSLVNNCIHDVYLIIE